MTKKLTKSDDKFLNFVQFRLIPDMRETCAESEVAKDLERLVKIARKHTNTTPNPEGW
jgi:hypothetical protein